MVLEKLSIAWTLCEKFFQIFIKKSNLELSIPKEKYSFGHFGAGYGLQNVNGNLKIWVNNKSPKINSIMSISVECAELADTINLVKQNTTDVPISIPSEDLKSINLSFSMPSIKIPDEEPKEKNLL